MTYLEGGMPRMLRMCGTEGAGEMGGRSPETEKQLVGV